MVVTTNGIRVSTHNKNSPSLEDIAVQTGRMPRFAGATRPWWSVLHHHFVCGELAEEIGLASGIETSTLKLYAMLHDAHEAITGDVPKGVKPEALSKYQEELDERIYQYFDIPEPTPKIRRTVKIIDNTALIAEAKSLCPPEIVAIFQTEGLDLYSEHILKCEKIIKSILRWLPTPDSTVYPHSIGVMNYIWTIQKLVHTYKVNLGYFDANKTTSTETSGQITQASHI